MTTFRSRSRRIAAAVAAGALAITLAACSGGTGSTGTQTISKDGTDDGTKLTLWTRAPLEKQAKLLVEAYNKSHKNQVALTVVPNDDYVAKVGAAAGSDGLPDLFAADIVYVPNWVQQGLFQDLTEQIDGLSYKDSINKGHLDPDKAPANLTEYAEAAKAVQALNKPDTYGTATGLNCGGCLVFTWFPSVW